MCYTGELPRMERSGAQPPSQNEKTMRDLARYDRGERSPEPIKALRSATEKQLEHQLKQANSFLDIQKVMALVFETDLPNFRTFVAAMLTAFDRDIEGADEDILQVIQDAWNYLPHRSLDGRCPAEVMWAKSRAVDKDL
jgi:hypothetical protein